MRVIKEGRNLSPSYRLTCDKCGCIFEYDYSDIKFMESDGVFGQYNYVFCPNSSCNKLHVILK